MPVLGSQPARDVSHKPGGRLPLLSVRPAVTPAILKRRRGVVVSGVRRMNEVNARRARLVPGWVTVFGRVYHLDM